MQKKKLTTAIATILLAASAAQAGNIDPFYADRQRGWFWHEDPSDVQPAPEPVAPPPPKAAAPTPAPAPAPAEPAPMSLAWVKANLETARDRAIDNPSRENVEAFLAIQKVYLDKSSKFSVAFQDTLRGSAFDENANWSAGTAGQRAVEQDVTDTENRLIKAVARVAGLWVFYRSDCSYCKSELPALINLRAAHGVKTMLISMDGLPLAGAESLPWVKDTGQAARLGVQATPTIFISHPASNTLVPVSHGAIAQDELTRRLVDTAVKAGWITTGGTDRLRLVPVPEVPAPAPGATVDTSDPRAVTAYIKQQLKLK